MRISKFIYLLLLLSLCSCEESFIASDSKVDSLPIILHVNIPFILAFHEDGNLWQWKRDEKGIPSDPQRVNVSNPVQANFLSGEYAWVRTLDNKIYIWHLSQPDNPKAENYGKPVVKASTEEVYSAFLLSDGSIFAPSFNIGPDNAEWQNIKDLVIAKNIIFAITNEGDFKFTGNTKCYAQSNLDTIKFKKIGSSTVNATEGSGTEYPYVVDDDGYFYFFRLNIRRPNLIKSKEPAICAFDDFLLEKDGDVVDILGREMSKGQLPPPDNTLYFKTLTLNQDYQRYQVRYEVGVDGSFRYTPIEDELKMKGKRPTRLTKVRETKTLPDIILNTSMFTN